MINPADVFLFMIGIIVTPILLSYTIWKSASSKAGHVKPAAIEEDNV